MAAKIRHGKFPGLSISKALLGLHGVDGSGGSLTFLMGKEQFQSLAMKTPAHSHSRNVEKSLAIALANLVPVKLRLTRAMVFTLCQT
jgi:hypothetical protein